METIQINTFCTKPFRSLILNSSGDASMCCDQYYQLGHIDPDTDLLRDIWNGPVAKELRERHLSGELHPICQSGNTCPYLILPKIYGESTICPDYPAHLEICLPDTHCNVGGASPTTKNPACLMCRRNFTKPSQNDITDFLCEKSLSLMPNLNSLCILGVAEPFWKGAIFNILTKLDFDNHRDHIELQTNTNGICMTPLVAEGFLGRVKWSDVAWSIDAANPSTYWKIRRYNIFQQVLNNLKRYNELRKNTEGCHKVKIYNNINLLNVDEMEEMVEQAKEVGADNIVFVPTRNYLPDVNLQEITINEKNFDIFRYYVGKAIKKGIELDFPVFVPHKEEFEMTAARKKTITIL